MIVAGGMLRTYTPVEDYRNQYGLWVKREDLSCPPPGPPFSKARGVYAHIASRPEKLIGVLDTSHSQAGHAVARACQVLGKKCLNFYPVYKHEQDPNSDPPQHVLRLPQMSSQCLGAELFSLPAGRSCILYHKAKEETLARGGYMMPNALKLEESVEETAKEVDRMQTDGMGRWEPDVVVIPASSGTIAAGVIRGFDRHGVKPEYIVHLGYSRPVPPLYDYLEKASGVKGLDKKVRVVDEGYAYADKARGGETPPWPCNAYYDLKAFRWFLDRTEFSDPGLDVLLWNIG